MEHEKCYNCGRLDECRRYIEEKRDECRNNGYCDYISRQQMEIDTIKKRTIEVKLSDADVKRLYSVAGSVNLTPGELLEQFIGDLVDGTYSNGSDERAIANDWLERCWFGMFPENTFLHYLIEWGEIECYLDELDDLITAKEELEYLQGDEYAKEELDDAIRAQEIKDAKEFYEEIEKSVNGYYEEYCKNAKECEPKEKAVNSVIEWGKARKKALE